LIGWLRNRSSGKPASAFGRALLRSSLDRCQALIGPERTSALFGEAVEDPEGLIDRASFLQGPTAH